MAGECAFSSWLKYRSEEVARRCTRPLPTQRLKPQWWSRMISWSDGRACRCCTAHVMAVTQSWFSLLKALLFGLRRWWTRMRDTQLPTQASMPICQQQSLMHMPTQKLPSHQTQPWKQGERQMRVHVGSLYHLLWTPDLSKWCQTAFHNPSSRSGICAWLPPQMPFMMQACLNRPSVKGYESIPRDYRSIPYVVWQMSWGWTTQLKILMGVFVRSLLINTSMYNL